MKILVPEIEYDPSSRRSALVVTWLGVELGVGQGVGVGVGVGLGLGEELGLGLGLGLGRGWPLLPKVVFSGWLAQPQGGGVAPTC